MTARISPQTRVSVTLAPWFAQKINTRTQITALFQAETEKAICVMGESSGTKVWVPRVAVLAMEALPDKPIEMPGEVEAKDIPITRADLPPWEHQKKAFWFAHDKRGAMLSLWMGCGKTRVAIDLIQNRGHQRVLIACPRAVIDTWPDEFLTWGVGEFLVVPLKGGTIPQRLTKAKAALAQAAARKVPCVLVINYEAAWQGVFGPWALNAGFDCVVMDECVPGDTTIATPAGDREISSLVEGDIVYGFDHTAGRVVETKVLHTFERATSEALVYIGALRMTGNHPVWTCRGYVRADEVSDLDIVMSIELKYGKGGDTYDTHTHLSMVREVVRGEETRLQREATEILRDKLLGEVEDESAGVCRESYVAGKAQEDVAANGGEAEVPGHAKKTQRVSSFGAQSISRPSGAREGEDGSARNGVHDAQRRQRHDCAIAASSIGCTSRVGAGICRQDERSTGVRGGFAKPLQDRHRCPLAADCSGSGRELTCSEVEETAGCEEGTRSQRPGVVSGEGGERSGADESGRCGTADIEVCRVYNIETGTGNYFADNLLVHNCHKLKSPAGKISRYFGNLAKRVPWRIALTGTPMPHSPLDIYAQFRALDTRVFGTTHGAFKQRYAIVGGFNGQVVVGLQRQEELQAKFYSLAFRVGKEVLTLPPITTVMRTFELSPKTRKIYDELEQEFYAAVDAGEVTITNALVKILRLQQVTSGFLKMDDDQIVTIGDEKLSALRDVLEDLEPDEPVTVIGRYHYDLDSVKALLGEMRRTCGELSGRRDDLQAWKDGQYSDLAIQLQSGDAGVTVVRAKYMIHYSLDHSLGRYQQVIERIHRPGQTRHTTYIHLVAERTIDQIILSALQKKKNVVEAVLLRGKED